MEEFTVPQVAHQLLNGKPTARGLRRQFSLDQGSIVTPLVSKATFRKAPSLEETSEYIQSSSCGGSIDRGESDTYTSLLTKSPNPNIPIEAPKDTNSSNPTTPNLTPHSDGNASGDSLVRQSSLSSRSLSKTRTLSVLEESPTQTRKVMVKQTSLMEEPEK